MKSSAEKGGGKPQIAQGGGPEIGRIGEALARGRALIESNLNG
jgi:alanyl-tRNA synthetase